MKGLGDDGATAAAKALHGNTRVATANLAANAIGFGGAKAWAGLLGLATTALVHLDLSRNRLGAAGAAAVVRAVERNTSLRTLLLDGNGVGNFGAGQMVRPLEQNVVLVALGLTSNAIATEAGDKVRAALARGRNARDTARLEVLY